MKNLIRNILFLILISSGFSACVYENYPDVGGTADKIEPNTTVLLLDLKALNPSTMTTPVEKIKSVRIVIVGTPTPEEDTDTPEGAEETPAIVEYNRLFEFPASLAQSFSYTVSWPSQLGPKSVYVIANEESVGEELTDKLGSYEEQAPAGDLEEWLGDFTFTPQYEAEGNEIYLPYTFSKTDFIPVPETVNPVNCWLVPAATKFVFHFINKRDNAVKINGISMASANSKSYVFPHVGSRQLYMDYGGEWLYWPDWLAAVSKASWDYPEFGENEGFNNDYGWITNYYVPDLADATPYVFVGDGADAPFPVDAAREITTEEGTETEASTATTRIYYLPESINYRINDEAAAAEPDEPEEEVQPEQAFYLTIDLEDMGPNGKAPKFENVPIPNLNALFRNTFVVIQMTMGQGDIEIYAEIAPWNRASSNGWVSEGNGAPSNNPFAVRKK